MKWFTFSLKSCCSCSAHPSCSSQDTTLDSSGICNERQEGKTNKRPKIASLSTIAYPSTIHRDLAFQRASGREDGGAWGKLWLMLARIVIQLDKKPRSVLWVHQVRRGFQHKFLPVTVSVQPVMIRQTRFGNVIKGALSYKRKKITPKKIKTSFTFICIFHYFFYFSQNVNLVNSNKIRVRF